ncbi:MAG: hypothetical protein ACUVRD_05850 [Bacteroidia bacterium]
MSVLFRLPQWDSPLARSQDWLTAQALMTFRIWDLKGGPQNVFFTPDLQYPDSISQRMSAIMVTHRAGSHAFYVSLPPGAYVLGYGWCKLWGGFTPQALRALSLLLHGLMALSMAFLARSLLSHSVFVAASASFLYLFTSGLWVHHGFTYFGEVVVQLFWIWELWILSELMQGKRVHPLLGSVGFLASYTEFLGFLGALPIVFLGWRKKQKSLAVSTLLGASLGIILTLWQYSSAIGWKNLVSLYVHRFYERGGLGENPFCRLCFKTYRQIGEHLNALYLPLLAVGVIGFLIPPRGVRLGSPVRNWLWISSLSPMGHFLIFTQFTALHAYSLLKWAPILIILVVWVWERKLLVYPVWALYVLGGAFGVWNFAHQQVREGKYVNLRYAHVGRYISTEIPPTVPVLTNSYPHPIMLYYAGRNVEGLISDTLEAKRCMHRFGWKEAYYIQQGRLGYQVKRLRL